MDLSKNYCSPDEAGGEVEKWFNKPVAVSGWYFTTRYISLLDRLRVLGRRTASEQKRAWEVFSVNSARCSGR